MFVLEQHTQELSLMISISIVLSVLTLFCGHALTVARTTETDVTIDTKGNTYYDTTGTL